MSTKAALVEHIAYGDPRRNERRCLRLEARAALSAAGEALVFIHNISSTGLLIESPESILSIGEIIVVEIPQRGPVDLKVVWKSDQYVGCEFEESLSRAAISAALLRGDALSPETLPHGAGVMGHVAGGRDLRPELNLSVASAITLVLWVAIVGLAFLAFR